MVMPRSRSSSIVSSSCGRCLRGSTAPVTSRMRSASVDFPWSMWAMIEKLRMLSAGARTRPMLGAPQPAADQLPDLARLLDPESEHDRDVDGQPRDDPDPEAHYLRDQRAAERVVQPVPDAVAHSREHRARDQDAGQRRDDLPALDAVQVAAQERRL